MSPRQDAPTTQDERLHHHFSTLAGAVHASRPGNTILLLPGEHDVHDAPISITHVVRILGDGAAKLCGDAGLEAVIQVQNTAQLCALRLSSQRGACIKHSAGTLRVVRCVLQSEAMGLPHLISQLTTDACGLRDRLIVEETRILGDCAMPVRALGTGEVARARAIYLPHQTFAWFEVDAGRPGIKRKRLEPPNTLARHIAQPKWAASFDPEQLQAALAWRGVDGCPVVGRQIDATQEIVVR